MIHSELFFILTLRYQFWADLYDYEIAAGTYKNNVAAINLL